MRWYDRIVEYPRRFAIVNNGDGTYTLNPCPGNVIQEGTPVNAANMNNIENKIDAHSADNIPHMTTDPSTNKVYRWGLAIQNGEWGIIYEEVV